MNLLVVDDAKFIHATIRSFLRDQPYTIVGQASNGRQALELVDELNPDLVTLDITMPEMDGLACLKEMISRKPSIRVLIVSALSDKSVAIEALGLGAKAFLNKPFTAQHLIASLKKIGGT